MLFSMNQKSLLLFLVACLSQVALGCNTSPDALTLAYGKDIPQTCIQVPNAKDGFDERCFYSYLPENCSSQDNLPLVMDVHGLGSCPLYSAGYTGWMQKAEEECFVVVWPSGKENRLQPRCFNTPGLLDVKEIASTNQTKDDEDEEEFATMPCCCLDDETFLPGEKAVDPLFLKMAIDHVVEERNETPSSIDTSRIYMAGHSNGCMMSLAMAALYSDTVAAVCCHAGSLTTPFPIDYSPVPIWMVHGMKDDIVPYEGKTMFPNWPRLGNLGFLSMDQILSYLGDKNECLDQEEEDVSDEDGIIGKVLKRTNCERDANIEVVALFEGGHSPYITPVLGESTTIDTTAMAWDFCSSHSKGPQPVLETTTVSNSVMNNNGKNTSSTAPILEETTEFQEALFASSAQRTSWFMGVFLVGAMVVNAL